MTTPSSVRAALLLLVAVTLVGGCGGCGGKKSALRADKKVKTAALANASAAPRPPPPPAAAADGSFTVGGLRYLEVVTGGARPSDTLPMVVAMHGHGGAADTYAQHFATFPLRARFIVPFAPHQAERSGFEWFPRVAKMSARELSRILPPVVATTATAITEIERVRPTVGKPVLTGFSQGAIMTYGLAVLRADMFSAACPMAGELPPDLIRRTRLPTIRPEIHAFHGDADHTVDFENGKMTVDALKHAGFVADLAVIRGNAHKYEPAAAQVSSCVDRAVRKVAAAPGR